MSFDYATIQSLCSRVASGGTPSRSQDSFWHGGTIPWLKTGELNDARVSGAEESITEDALQKSSAKVFPENTVLMAMYGDGKTITTLGILDTPCSTNQACAAMIANPDICDYRYLFYALRRERHKLLKLVVAGAQRNLSLGIIKNFEIPCPELPIQRRIASILSAYDDLIEINRRRISLLEESVQLIYREWFVHFRFPGNEHVKVVRGVPDNFELVDLGRLCKLRGGNAFKTKFQGKCSGDYPFIKVGDMNSSGNSVSITEANNWVSELDAKEMKAKSFPSGTIVFAKIGEALKQNRIRILKSETLIDNNMMGAIPNEEIISSELLYCLLSNHDIASHASGAAVPFLTASILSKLKFPIPDKSLCAEFDCIVAPLLQQIAKLQFQITATAKARDLLLPRLMDGRLEV